MSSWLYSVLRTGAQALVGYLVAYLGSRGVDVPIGAQDWLVQVLLVGGAITVYTAAVRWLETRRGDRLWARGARALARLLMFGLTAKQPVYVAGDERLRVVMADGTLRPPR